MIEPGETSVINLYVEDLTDWTTDFKRFQVVSGASQQTNHLMLANTNWLDSLIASAPNMFTNDGTVAYKEYGMERLRYIDEQLSKLDSFNEKHGIHDIGYIDWAQTQIRYRGMEDLSVFPFFAQTNRDIHDEMSYFDFARSGEMDTSTNVPYLQYYDFIKSLAMSYRIISNVSKRYEIEREALVPDSGNLPIAFRMVKKLPPTTFRQLVMAALYLDNTEVSSSYTDSLIKYVDPTIANMALSIAKAPGSTLMELLEEYDIPFDEKTALINSYADCTGKVVFHDFWFTNCAPCMSELPYYNDLITRMEGKAVFIFYGVFMTESDWKSTIEEYQLQGQHHLLSANQLAFFEKYFRLQGFPHRQIINASGEIGEKVDYGVYPQNYSQIEKMIGRANNI